MASSGRRSPSRILHHPVIDLAEPKRDDVERVILVEPPWPFRALLGQFRDRALHVAGGEIQRRQLSNSGVAVMRHALLIAMPLHVVDQAANIFAGEITF